MLTFAELEASPERLAELQGMHVLVSAGHGEVVVSEAKRRPEATMVFMHETIKMMQAERAERLDKLRQQLGPTSLVVPLRKKAGSFWDHVTVGRVSTADIVVDDPAVSNVHAHFELPDGDAVTVQDVGSSNGTFLNRVQLQPHKPTELRTGDCLRFGQSIFYFVSGGTLADLLGARAG